MKNLKIKLFFKKTKFSLRCPDHNIFRLLKLNSFKNKKVLDIGYGNGENLIEFDRRGATTYGISLVNNAKYIKKFLSNYKENNYCHRDLNKNSLIKCLEKMKIIQNIGGRGGVVESKQAIKTYLITHLILLFALIQFTILIS